MLKSIAQTAPVHTYIAEATYNENCYADADHVIHTNVSMYQSVESPAMALEGVISVDSGDTLVLSGTQSFRNYIVITFRRNNNSVGSINIQNLTAFNQTVTSSFSGEIDAISIRFAGGGSGMTAVNLKITKNGEEWLN